MPYANNKGIRAVWSAFVVPCSSFYIGNFKTLTSFRSFQLHVEISNEKNNIQTNWNELIESQVILIGNTRGDQII